MRLKGIAILIFVRDKQTGLKHLLQFHFVRRQRNQGQDFRQVTQLPFVIIIQIYSRATQGSINLSIFMGYYQYRLMNASKTWKPSSERSAGV